MHIFKTIQPLKKFLTKAVARNKTVGLVPTMGTLHEGHLALVNKSLEDNDISVCSIYVNPTQFNNPQDLEKYPRNLASDLAMLEKTQCQVVFCPSDEEMYPEGKENSLTINMGYLNTVLEGKYRPGHFSGVGVVLSKLFHIVNPDRVYFGQKDLQQVAVVQNLIHNLFFDLQLIRVPTVRNESGLALSSRNNRLSESDKITATALYRALMMIKEELQKKPAQVVAAQQKGLRFLENEGNIKVEYLEIIDTEKFGIVSDTRNHQEIAICIAAYVGEVRLIDNVLL